MAYKTLQITQSDSVIRVAFNRPQVMNALNIAMIEETTHVFQNLSHDTSVRVIILEGNGKTFSAGADLGYMKQLGKLNIDQNIIEGKKLAEMYVAIQSCSKPIIAKAHGYAIGGGFGFLVLADIAIAEENTQFSLSEVKLGMNPAVIGPFVTKKIGASHYKALSITGELIDTKRALNIGLIHEVASASELEKTVMKKVRLIMKCGPIAIAEFKATFENTDLNKAVDQIAKLRASEEGQEGLSAFLEKRNPNW
jgi:methylglutaconyl-CoA hydratase